MPDTGAPWNIPYVESADLVSDWPADSLLVANAVAAGLSAAGNAGIGSNVVSVTKLDTFSTTSTTFADVTDLTVTITPTTATSKILVLGFLSYSVTGLGSASHFRLVRDSTAIAVGNADGARVQTTTGTGLEAPPSAQVANGSVVFLDSPATTSPVVYKWQGRVATGGTLLVNRTSTDTNSAGFPRSVSGITVIEVAV